jgi:hypothetical protein
VTSQLEAVHQAMRHELELKHRMDRSMAAKLQDHVTSSKLTKCFHQLLQKLQKEKTNLVGSSPATCVCCGPPRPVHTGQSRGSLGLSGRPLASMFLAHREHAGPARARPWVLIPALKTATAPEDAQKGTKKKIRQLQAPHSGQPFFFFVGFF